VSGGQRARAVALRALLAALVLGTGYGSVRAQESRQVDAEPAPESVVAPGDSGEDSLDVKLERANQFLATPEQYPDAIRGYREILAIEPRHREARLRLAQVLSWSGELSGSIEEYDRLLELYPDDLELELNRAEVLSWSGATESSLESFEKILERDRGNARAARGVARSLLWSGKQPAAYRAYERALELEDDPEARKEWDELRKTLRPRLEVETNTFSDSADFDRRDVFVEYSGFQDMSTRIGVRLGWVQISHPQDDVALAVRSPFDDDSGLDLGLVLNHTLDSGPKLTLEVGGRKWTEAGLAPYLRAHWQHTFESVGSVSLQLVHEGYGDISNSFEAVQEDIQHTALAASLYRQISAKLGAFGRLDIGSLSDGNSRQSLYAALSYHPWVTTDADISVGTNMQRFANDSPSYYAPEQDLGLELLWQHRIPLTKELQFRYQGALGFQSTKEASASESGTLWSAESELRWERDPWTARLRFGVSYSQRSARYNTRRGLLEVIREF